MNNYCVLTTINKPTKAIEVLYEKFGERLIVVGDEKTLYDPWPYRKAEFLAYCHTRYYNKPYAPLNHYARKNIGYLEAIKAGANLIYDTDDDNIPNKEWGLRFKETKAAKSYGEGWFNAYQPMTSNPIWPRGFPLSKIKGSGQMFGTKEPVVSSIQQGLSDGEPDVDAIYRLIFEKKNEFKFDRSIYLDKNTWCPFNSQSTWWFPDAYPLLYLPITATFRMTDIWRSFIAQRCLWELGQGVTFHSPSEVYQERNEHDLMDDFEKEVPGYLNNEGICETLQGLTLKPGKENVCDNLFECYCALAEKGLFQRVELDSLEKWIEDYENIK